MKGSFAAVLVSLGMISCSCLAAGVGTSSSIEWLLSLNLADLPPDDAPIIDRKSVGQGKR